MEHFQVRWFYWTHHVTVDLIYRVTKKPVRSPTRQNVSIADIQLRVIRVKTLCHCGPSYLPDNRSRNPCVFSSEWTFYPRSKYTPCKKIVHCTIWKREQVCFVVSGENEKKSNMVTCVGWTLVKGIGFKNASRLIWRNHTDHRLIKFNYNAEHVFLLTYFCWCLSLIEKYLWNSLNRLITASYHLEELCVVFYYSRAALYCLGATQQI